MVVVPRVVVTAVVVTAAAVAVVMAAVRVVVVAVVVGAPVPIAVRRPIVALRPQRRRPQPTRLAAATAPLPEFVP